MSRDSSESRANSASEILLTLGDEPAQKLVEAFPGMTVGGVTVIAWVGDEHFASIVSTGPKDDQIENFPPFERRLIASKLYELARKWEP